MTYDDWKTHNPDDDRCEFCGAAPWQCRGGWQPDRCTGECRMGWRDPDAEYDAMRDEACLFGESSSTIADSKASTAPCSETKAASYRPTLSDRLTPLLISAGLVKGTTHTSIRKQSGAAIRATALWPLDGGSAE